jgi:hypothetical protein
VSAGETFPFFTIPFFGVQGGEAQEISGAGCSLLLLSKTSDREATLWLIRMGDQGLSYQGRPDVDPRPYPRPSFIPTGHHGKHKKVQNSTWMATSFQFGKWPVHLNSSIVNLDLMTAHRLNT